MIRPAFHRPPAAPLVRLGALAPLGPDARAALTDAMARTDTLRARREMFVEGAEISGPRLIVSGWAARVRLFPDGRRQFLSFLLPGDLTGVSGQPRALSTATVSALTELTTCPAPAADALPGLAAAYATSHALDEAYLLAQIARLGRMTAPERIADLLLELHERLALAGLADGRGFALPLTQELLADALGLTAVHVNRMLQQARRAGEIAWRNGWVAFDDAGALARRVGRLPARVSAR